MHPSLKRITDLLSPPNQPVGFDRSWVAVEQELGVPLPEDYKSFIDAYGSGKICSEEGGLDIWNFRDASLPSPLSVFLCGDGGVIQQFREILSLGYEWPYPLYPVSQGILPFGAVNDVHHLNWLMRGKPDDWNIVYFNFDEFDDVHLLEGDTFTGYLMKALSKEYERPIDPDLEPPVVFCSDSTE